MHNLTYLLMRKGTSNRYLTCGAYFSHLNNITAISLIIHMYIHVYRNVFIAELPIIEDNEHEGVDDEIDDDNQPVDSDDDNNMTCNEHDNNKRM